MTEPGGSDCARPLPRPRGAPPVGQGDAMTERPAIPRPDDAPAALVRGLPRHFYTDPAVFAEEKEKIFYRTWQYLGHIAMVPKHGSYFVGKVADQEILVVRGEDGLLRAFYNVCQHRGHPLATGSGRCKRFACPYHAWLYDLDGRLHKAPQSEDIPGFDPNAVRLSPVRLDTLAGLIFVNLDSSASPIRESFGQVEDELRRTKPNIEDQTLVYEHPMAHGCNWKASVEGFSECYHCAPVHKYLTDNVIDPETYILSASGLVQRHYIRGRDPTLDQILWFLWPNLAVGLYPIPGFGTTLCTRHIYPLDHAHTIYHYRWFVDADRPSEPVVNYARHHAATTGAEDAAVASAIQTGLGSRGFDRAWLLANPRRGAMTEHAIAQFHTLVRAALGGTAERGA